MAASCRYDRQNPASPAIGRNRLSHFNVLVYKTSAMPSDPPSGGRPRAVHELYLVKSLVHGSEVLWAFQQPGETLRLRDVMDRTGFPKGMCFRLLYTLRHCGFIEKVENNRYRLTGEIRRRKKYRIGYAGQGQDSSFADEVRKGLVRAAERAQIELIVVDNRYQPRVALKTRSC